MNPMGFVLLIVSLRSEKRPSTGNEYRCDRNSNTAAVKTHMLK